MLSMAEKTSVFYKIKFHLKKYYNSFRFFNYKYRLSLDLKELQTFKLEKDSSIVIAILCGKKTVDEAIATLYSFYSNTDRRYSLAIFDDGTLTFDCCNKIHYYFKNSYSLLRKEADEKVLSFLDKEHLLKIKELRHNLVFASRLTDINFFMNGKIVIQLDSDVLFFNEPSEILQIVEGNCGEQKYFSYNKDIMSSYCGNIEAIYKATGIKITPNFNAGLCTYIASVKNLYFFEEKLAEGLPVKNLYYAEQTLLALLMTVREANPLPPVYDLGFQIYRPFEENVLKVKSRHYCGYTRPFFYPHFHTLKQSKVSK